MNVNVEGNVNGGLSGPCKEVWRDGGGQRLAWGSLERMRRKWLYLFADVLGCGLYWGQRNSSTLGEGVTKTSVWVAFAPINVFTKKFALLHGPSDCTQSPQ